jgi:hypothetical protein
MASKKKEGHELGVGPYSKNDVKFTRSPDPGNSVDPKGRQLDTDVTRNSERTSGFSAPLDKGK